MFSENPRFGFVRRHSLGAFVSAKSQKVIFPKGGGGKDGEYSVVLLFYVGCHCLFCRIYGSPKCNVVVLSMNHWPHTQPFSGFTHDEFACTLFSAEAV